MVSRTRALAFASGLIVGAFLFFGFGWDSNVAFAAWQWYLAASLLAGIGLAGIFPAAWLSAVAGLVVGPVLLEAAQTARHLVRDPSCCNLFPVALVMVFFFCLPAPLLGGSVCAHFAHKDSVPRAVWGVTLAAGLAVGALLPSIQNARLRLIETRKIPQLLGQIHDAELAYSARQPDGRFACDGAQLPGAMGKMGWYPARQSLTRTFFIDGEYSVSLECFNNGRPRGFLLNAAPAYPALRAARLLMDQSGKLVVVPAP